jgi:hypothetical protein
MAGGCWTASFTQTYACTLKGAETPDDRFVLVDEPAEEILPADLGDLMSRGRCIRFSGTRRSTGTLAAHARWSRVFDPHSRSPV